MHAADGAEMLARLIADAGNTVATVGTLRDARRLELVKEQIAAIEAERHELERHAAADACGVGRSQLFLEQPSCRPHTESMGGKETRSSILGGAASADVEDSSPAEGGSTLTNHLLIAMPSLSRMVPTS